ncbi:MAG: hypothetical protein ABI678_03780, partial [Kofleriaceae bacterium]
QLLTNPDIWRALHNLDYNAAALDAHWRNYNKRRPPSKTLASTTFGEYLGTRGVSTELDTGSTPAPSPKLTEVFPNWEALSTTTKQRTLLQTYEPTLVSALDPGSTALPPHVKAALEAALNKGQLGGSSTVRGAREKLSSAVNEALAKSARTPADLEAIMKLVGGSGSKGSIGEDFVGEHLVDKTHGANDKSQLVITKEEVPELEVQESFRPDRVIPDAHYTLDVKVGYANTDLDLKQARNYRTLRDKSQSNPTLAAKLGGPIDGHAWLLLPGGEKPALTVALEKRAYLDINGFQADRVLFLGSDGQIYQVNSSGPPVARGTNIHAALGIP